MKKNEPIVTRGEIWYADLSPVIGSEQGGLRPVLIVQNELGNRHAPTTIAVPITSRFTKKPLPTHIEINSGILSKDSIALCEQLRTIDKMRLKNKMGKVNEETITALNKALAISLELSKKI